jgi:cell volume regulation protein A
MELLSFYIDEALVVSGVSLEDLGCPDRSSVTLIVRGNRLIPPRGQTVLQPGDQPLIQLMLGRPEAE